MKQAVLVFCILAALSSCASLPEPEEESNSLVIGYFALDFPEGYFNGPPRKIENGIRLHFLNDSRQSGFSALTSSGYYYFLASGTDDYRLESYEYEDVGAKVRVGPAKMDWKFGISPGKLVYLGHLTTSWKSEKAKVDAATGRKTSGFDVDSSMRWEREATLRYIRELNPDSRWLEYELVQATMRE